MSKEEINNEVERLFCFYEVHCETWRDFYELCKEYDRQRNLPKMKKYLAEKKVKGISTHGINPICVRLVVFEK